jgi:hypothetical protein
MNTKMTLILIAAMSFAAPAMAATNLSADQLVAKSGLSKQEVRMLIGARTPYPAYRTNFERVRKQLIAAVGQKGYDELVAELRRESSDASAG